MPLVLLFSFTHFIHFIFSDREGTFMPFSNLMNLCSGLWSRTYVLLTLAVGTSTYEINMYLIHIQFE